MSALHKAVKAHEKRAMRLGHVPRRVRVPKVNGTLGEITDLLYDRAHRAMVDRITKK